MQCYSPVRCWRVSCELRVLWTSRAVQSAGKWARFDFDLALRACRWRLVAFDWGYFRVRLRADCRDSNWSAGGISRSGYDCCYTVVEAAAGSCSTRCQVVYKAAMAGPAGVDAIHCNSRAAFYSFLRAVLYSGCFQQVMGLYAPREWSAATSSAVTPQTAIFVPVRARLASRTPS